MWNHDTIACENNSKQLLTEKIFLAVLKASRKCYCFEKKFRERIEMFHINVTPYTFGQVAAQ